MAGIKLEIVTPEKLVLSETVEMVTLPGVEGDFGVLFDHSPLISELRAGEVAIYTSQNGEPVKRLYIDGGIAQVTGSNCTVLVAEVSDAPLELAA